MATDTGTQAAPTPQVTPEQEARRAASLSCTESVQSRFRNERVSYGSHPRQVMDIYYPANTPTAAPVLAWIHGGGLRVGEPARDGYNGEPYLEHGAIFVSLGYRLVPDARFPTSADDIEQALRWLHDNIKERGGDPDRIFLSGHSAGSMLAASVGLRNWQGSDMPADLIKGLVLISGMYDSARQNEEIVDRTSPRYVPNLFDAIQRVPPHTILVGGDADFPTVLPDARALKTAIEAKGGSAEMFVEPDADHFAAIKSFNTDGGTVFEAVRRMMRLD